MHLRQSNFGKKKKIKRFQYNKNSMNKINAKIDFFQRVGVLRL